jgi:GT2 family glycosyltransferase
LSRGDLGYAWLLNNDTVVSPDALSALVSCARKRPNVGICGSTLLYYDSPEIVQTRGGVAYNRWLATMRPLARGAPIQQSFDHCRIERRMSYPVGASMLVTGEFLRSVGLLSEAYFLYYEELDWVTRAGPRFTVGYSAESLVYHKEGRSIATDQADPAFHTADYYAHRSRLRYTRQFFPFGLPTTVLRTMAAVIARLYRRQPRRAWAILRLIFSRNTYAFPESEAPAGQWRVPDPRKS